MINLNLPIKSDFDSYKVNEKLTVYNGNAEVIIGDYIQKSEIEIYFNFPFSSSLEYETTDDIISMEFIKLNDDHKSVDYIKTNDDLIGEVGGTMISINHEESIVNEFNGQLKRYYSQNIPDIDSLEFCLFNCSSVGERNKKIVTFQDEDWEILIQERKDYEETIKTLNVTNGFGVTHIGIIKRKDRMRFYPDDTNKLIKGLEWLLSFLNERHIGVPITIGYQGQEKVWEEYISVNIDSYDFSTVWLSREDYFVNMYPYILSRLDDIVWNKVFDQLLEWYIEIRSGKLIGNQIISVQLALELIAWNYIVIDKEILSKKAFKTLNTSDLFRILFYEFQIDKFFNEFNLHKELNKYKGDGIFTLTEVRNSIIHPDKPDEFSEDATFTVYRYGLSCLHHSILYLLNYEGKYKTMYSSLLRNANHEQLY